MTNHLKMDEPTPSRLDQGAQGLIGKPLDRYEGPLKVAGAATYAHEQQADRAALHGYIVLATIAHGRVVSIDATAARAMPGVVDVITGDDGTIVIPGFGAGKYKDQADLQHFGQPVAMVVAETFEQARAAASRVEPRYQPHADGRFILAEHRDTAEIGSSGLFVPLVEKGDADAALAQSPVKVDVEYTTPSQSHAPMEPPATLAEWNGKRLTLHTSTQTVASVRTALADILSMKEKHIRLISPYVGGGFGLKLNPTIDMVLAARAARLLDRPVKVAMTRRQVFQATSRRCDTIQRVALGADEDGRLRTVIHDSIVSNLAGRTFWEPAGQATQSLYAAPNRRVSHRVAVLDLLQAGPMRAPGEAVGMLALENAMDELAEKLGIDPVELRRRNEPDCNPVTGRPFSTRQLVACMDEGARRFGWDARSPTPGARREGEWLIGMGMASAERKNLLSKSKARATLRPDGTLVIETDMTDIGTGTYSILAQIAGEMLGLPLDRVIVRLGDSDMPASAGSGGSWGAASSGSSVYLACEAVIARIAKTLDADPDALTFKDGQVIHRNQALPLAGLAGGDGVSKTGRIEQGALGTRYSQSGYGAHFAEVAVNAVTGETRVRRMLGVFAAGRILNEKTARSQCVGGIMFGIGAALTEHLVVDPRHGHFVNHDLAEYLLPAHADAPSIDVVFVDERDDKANPIHAKGIGELATSGAGAAVTNAIYNACGVRVRDYPLTLDAIIAGMG
jgi:xanthine dehydrogenase YagR molybdenum-binding subunit